MLDGIEPDGTATDAVSYGGRDVLDAERLHQPQNLHEFALAFSAHARLQQAAQGRELLRQLPVGERCGLFERIDLLLDQREVVQRIQDEVFAQNAANCATTTTMSA